MSETAEVFGCVATRVKPLSNHILESARTGEDYARGICDSVRDFNDPSLLAALRETFEFFLKGAISLHRKGKRPEFWEGTQEQRQVNFCAQVLQLCAAIHISRFLEQKHISIDWTALAKNIPSEVRPERPITPYVARQFVGVFARASRPDPVLVRALPLVLLDPTDFNACVEALKSCPLNGTGHTPAPEGLLPGKEKHSPPTPCLAA